MEEFLTSHNILICLFGSIFAFLICLFGSIFAFWLNRIDKKFDKVDARFDKVDTELKEIRKDISGLDSRISRIEGPLWLTCSSLHAGRSNENAQKEAEK